MTTIKRYNLRLLILILLAGLGAGCSSLPRSGFDPYGEKLFESCPLSPSNCDIFGRRSAPTPPPISSASPGDGATVFPPPSTIGPAPISNALPGDLGASVAGSSAIPQYGSTATTLSPGARGVNTALLAAPETDRPRPVFEDTGGYAMPTAPIEGPALVMTPREQIAPVGSEVVLISSYLGKKDRLVTNEKI